MAFLLTLKQLERSIRHDLAHHVVTSSNRGVRVHVRVVLIGLNVGEANFLGNSGSVESSVESSVHELLQVGAPLDRVPKESAKSVDVGEGSIFPVSLFQVSIAYKVDSESSAARPAHQEAARLLRAKSKHLLAHQRRNESVKENGSAAIPSLPQPIDHAPHVHEAELVVRSVEEVREVSLVDDGVVNDGRILGEEGLIELRSSSGVTYVPLKKKVRRVKEQARHGGVVGSEEQTFISNKFQDFSVQTIRIGSQ